MVEAFERFQRLFEEIGERLEARVDIYIIGGAALLYRGLKTATKDIDIVVSSREEFDNLEAALLKYRFYKKNPGVGYQNMNLSHILEKDEFRIDLFEKRVCSKFSLSDGMKDRSEKISTNGNLKAFICSNEDIFLFKTMTEREGDITDCMAIASTQAPDWSMILEELKTQVRMSGQDIWVTWVGERLEILLERKIDIPIMKEIYNLIEEFYDNLENSG